MEDLLLLRDALRATSEYARNQLQSLIARKDFLERLKFDRYGCDPLDLNDKQNLAEQIDQHAT